MAGLIIPARMMNLYPPFFVFASFFYFFLHLSVSISVPISVLMSVPSLIPILVLILVPILVPIFIFDSCAFPSDNLISLSYSMAAFSANLFGFFTPCAHSGVLLIMQMPPGMYYKVIAEMRLCVRNLRVNNLVLCLG